MSEDGVNLGQQNNDIQQKSVTDLTPIILIKSHSIQNMSSERPLIALCDSGSTTTLINKNSLPYGVRPYLTTRKRVTTTANGSFDSSQSVWINDIQLPEFGNGRHINGVNAIIFDSPQCHYDVILGRDFLTSIGMKLCFNNHKMQWLDTMVEMKMPRTFQSLRTQQMSKEDQSYLAHIEETQRLAEEELEDMELFATSTEILERKYDKITAEEVSAKQNHMTPEQKELFQSILQKYERVFDGKLGHYTKRKIHIQLKPNAKPIFQKPYSIPYQREAVFKQELDNLVKDGVLERCGPSEWAFPTFIIPKKDGRVRWVSDLRKLNELIDRRPYPLPKIHDIMHRRGKYTFFTKIDISMQYYCFELDEASSRICTIITPFGLYRYKRVPMGMKISGDVAQAIMEEILQNVDCSIYMDDIGVWTSGSFADHMRVIDIILKRLNDNGLKCNPLKCSWAVQETDFLGHWMTPEGIKPWKTKVQAVLDMQRPRNQSEVRSFLGAVNYYKSLWPRRSHVLAPLTALTGTGPFRWDKPQQQAFDEMKSILVADALNAYPDYTKPFEVYADASDYQLGAAIIQDKRPIAYFSKKLSAAQQNYTTTEKELLALVSCLQEYRKILYGARITLYTDHKNLTFRTFSQQRVLRWRLFIDDFNAELKYLEGSKNVLADCFSRLPKMDPPAVRDREHRGIGKPIDFNKLVTPPDDTSINGEAFFLDEDNELIECLLCLPELRTSNPITFQTIHNHQRLDPKLQEIRQQSPHLYPVINFEGTELIVNQPTTTTDWKIIIPRSLKQRVIEWYHLSLGHCGHQRLYDTISTTFTSPDLRKACEQYKCPDNCHQYKSQGRGYGYLPPRNAQLLPWKEVCVDLIGPWEVKIPQGKLKFMALTCIDPVTNIAEIVRIDNKTSRHVAEQFENCWLARYPRPNRCVSDNGSEFIGYEFEAMLNKHGIKQVLTTVKNPQSNAICERMHQTVGDILRVILRTNPPQTEHMGNQAVDNAIASCVHALRCAVNHTMRTSPGAMVFGRDMFMDIPLIANIQEIRKRRQKLIDMNLHRANQKRIDHNYRVGEKVMIHHYDPSKLQPRSHGPYTILQTNTNGTIKVKRNNNIEEVFNIRKVTPYRGV